MSSTIRVGVVGAAGRMGRTVCEAVVADPDLELVAAIDPQHAGLDLRTVAKVDSDLRIAASLDELLDARADVLVDFTVLEVSRGSLEFAAQHGIHAVVGTTGFTDDDLERFRQTFTRSSCFIAPNFAIGAVLMMRFAELAAPHFATVEIIERHSERKPDAPSGTALQTAARVAAAGGRSAPKADELVEGSLGGDVEGVHVHSLRLAGLLSHQEVALTNPGEQLSIVHQSTSYDSFAAGAVAAVRAVVDMRGVAVGLDDVLGLK